MEKMMDLIERQKAIDALKEKRNSAKEWYEEASASGDEMMLSRAESAMMTFVECILTIKKLPFAHPEIIICRDCKHWREGDAYSYCQKLFNCGVLDVYDYMRAEDDFCSLAERREE